MTWFIIAPAVWTLIVVAIVGVIVIGVMSLFYLPDEERDTQEEELNGNSER